MACVAVLVLPCVAGVNVNSPGNNSTVPNPAHFAATASSSSPITAMAVYVDNNLAVKVGGGSLDQNVNMALGKHYVVVQAWDSNGGVQKTALTVNVSNGAGPGPGPGPGNVVSNIEKMSGWQACSSCAGPGGHGATAQHSITQHVSSPSLDGNSTQFWLGSSSRPYSNVLNFNPLGGRAGASNFVLDFNFYINDARVAQGLEMDIFYTRNGKKNYFLTECDSRGNYAGTWQVSNAVADAWQHTGLPCQIKSYSWNHVTLEFYRQPDGNTRFVSVSMNGNKQYVNRTYPAGNANAFEMNAAIQLDGDDRQDNWSVWVDNMSIRYW